MQESFVDVGGIRTRYIDEGQGSPLILIHGSGPGVSSYDNWFSVIPALSSRYRVLAPEMVGFGETEFEPDQEFGIKVWSKQLLGFMDALSIPQALLVGNSFGGGLSLAVASRNPGRIAGMVLMGTPSGEFEQTGGLAGGASYEPSIDSMRKMLLHFPYDPAIVTDDMIERRYTLSLKHVGNPAFKKLMPPPPKPGEPIIVRGVPLAQLEAIETPTLIVHGREDHVIPFEIAVRTEQHMPNADLLVFSRCGHWVQHEKTSRFVAAVMDFARDLECVNSLWGAQ